jgi:hypothetical protein
MLEWISLTGYQILIGTLSDQADADWIFDGV